MSVLKKSGFDSSKKSAAPTCRNATGLIKKNVLKKKNEGMALLIAN